MVDTSHMDALRTHLPDLAATVLLLDIDGVLAPIVADPTASSVPATTLDLLARARDRCLRVGCVTGRSLEDALRLVPVDGLWVCAAHGMHVRRPDGGEWSDPVATAAREQLDTAVQLARTVGWRFEDKGASVTYHFRHVATPEVTARQMRAQISTVLDPLVVEVVDARMALEVRPRGAQTKADAVRRVLENAGPHATHVLYLGDDTTDLDAFAAVRECGLVGVRVAIDSAEAPAALREHADVILRDQSAVDGFLVRLLDGQQPAASVR